MKERKATDWNVARLLMCQVAAVALVSLNSSALVQRGWAHLETGLAGESAIPTALGIGVGRLEIELAAVAAFMCLILHYAFAGPQWVIRLRLARCFMILTLVCFTLGVASWSGASDSGGLFSGLFGFVLAAFTTTAWIFGGAVYGRLAIALSLVFWVPLFALVPLEVMQGTVAGGCVGLVILSLLYDTPAHTHAARGLLSMFDTTGSTLRKLASANRLGFTPPVRVVKRS
jgi:hypothetical protein